MPGRPLPTFSQSDVASHRSTESCFVTVGSKVYDVTSFLSDHPGGGDLIIEYGGKDVTEILKDEISHRHSDAAYEILDESLIGYVATDAAIKTAANISYPGDILPLPPSVNGKAELSKAGVDHDLKPSPVYEATGMSSADDLSVDTDPTADFKVHKFLDLNRPLFPQIWYGGFSKDFYLEQVHRPRHYRGGDSAPLFGNILEPLSKTAWWVVPTIWLPCVTYGSVYGLNGLSTAPEAIAYWGVGLCLWTFLEYVLHRGLFHVDQYLPNNRVAITVHFLLHGIHHYLPMDRYRLVMPPALFLVLAIPFYYLAHLIFRYSEFAAIEVFSGGLFGYVCYDLTHYFLHHRNLPSYYRELKKYHLQHHFADYENGFGVTSRFWDRVFGTQLDYVK
jgi:4-hydroxysphinganine ceramide fatty acyl 2-hydroxylase